MPLLSATLSGLVGLQMGAKGAGILTSGSMGLSFGVSC